MVVKSDVSRNSERRRYFRVTDEIGLKYVVAEPVRTDEAVVEPGVRLRSDILALEGRIRAGLENLKSHGNPVAATLELINRKINLLFAEELPGSIEEQESVVRSVSLSACGIAFRACAPLATGASLKLEVTLLPSHLRLDLRGLVIECADLGLPVHPAPDEAGDERYLLRIDFTDLLEDAQEVLIQHVLKCQTRDLRQRREARETPAAE